MISASSIESLHRAMKAAGLTLLTALAALAFWGVPPPAQAQGRAETTATSGQLEEIIVTAQKRSENVQNVPIAMQAYTGEQLQQAGVGQITDITKLAPNLNVVVQNALSQHIVIRGVGT
ncbi:MAG TPA: hypothetical protein VGO53_09240, partial [Steroidobacteraceae bacterium]|nr:hypothetical protein [Steroidobacteraceae bacterium]